MKRFRPRAEQTALTLLVAWMSWGCGAPGENLFMAGNQGGTTADGGAASTASGGPQTDRGTGAFGAGNAISSGAFGGTGAASDADQADNSDEAGSAGGLADSSASAGAAGASANAGANDGGALAAAGGAEVFPSDSSSAGSAGEAGAGPTLLELATGRPATASTEQASNLVAYGNDGLLTTRWSAYSGSFPQWWRVDLGAVHELRVFTVCFEFPNRNYTYQIETSTDDALYTVQASLIGSGAIQSGAFAANVSARYVRITITNAAASDTTHQTWASIFEFSVLGI